MMVLKITLSCTEGAMTVMVLKITSSASAKWQKLGIIMAGWLVVGAACWRQRRRGVQ